jgi:hypothetical protein
VTLYIIKIKNKKLIKHNNKKFKKMKKRTKRKRKRSGGPP